MNDPVEAFVLPNEDFKSVETITIEDNIDILSGDSIAIDGLKKVKMIADPSRLHLATNRIKKKYLCQKSKGTLKKKEIKKQLTG